MESQSSATAPTKRRNHSWVKFGQPPLIGRAFWLPAPLQVLLFMQFSESSVLSICTADVLRLDLLKDESKHQVLFSKWPDFIVKDCLEWKAGDQGEVLNQKVQCQSSKEAHQERTPCFFVTFTKLFTMISSPWDGQHRIVLWHCVGCSIGNIVNWQTVCWKQTCATQFLLTSCSFCLNLTPATSS